MPLRGSNHILLVGSLICIFFFNDTATTEIYTLSLHDALPISTGCGSGESMRRMDGELATAAPGGSGSAASPSGGSASTTDRKSTRLNSSHANISYAVFCLKKKKIQSTFPPDTQDLLYPAITLF